MASEDFESRLALTRCIGILGGITLVVSIVAIAIGMVSISVTQEQWEFPFTVGGAMIAGILTLLLSCCPITLYCEDRKSEVPSYTTECFSCCTTLMVIWCGITILAVSFAFGLSGIYGVVSCSNEELKLKACSSAAESKMAISIVTIILTLMLFILSLAIFFTCCCNASTFGVPLLNSSHNCMESGDTFHGFDNYHIEPSPPYIDRQIYNRQQQEHAIQETLSEARINHFRSPSYNSNNDNNMQVYESSAPDISEVVGETGPNSSAKIESQLDDPPPSYDEVMKKEQTDVLTV
ncbi:uncharacterized protein LOC132736158 isoform X3 [Ruditapes philippinarum]|uniref:uncharacterized protein LOC132736158 isoform X3 n=1 Tax=Ruditapes philippinarum TaxID=129788 RepID=UPI00295C03AF|nr:uncharacterized protein LOC132736158 isoform X3 [Ruditapes philippinarum]